MEDKEMSNERYWVTNYAKEMVTRDDILSSVMGISTDNANFKRIKKRMNDLYSQVVDWDDSVQRQGRLIVGGKVNE